LRERLSEESRRRLETNPLRILDTKSPEEQALLKDAPKLSDSLTPSSRSHFEKVCSSMEAFRLSYSVEPRLVRGLDYYTNTVFEIVSEGLGAQNAICGGGAYESLVEELGGPPTYGVGFAIGEDRLIDVLPADSRERRSAPGPVLIRVVPARRSGANESTDIEAEASRLAEELRSAGVPAISLGAAEPKRSFAEADALASPAIVILGESELSDATLTIRTVATREQATVPRVEAIENLKRHFA
jgi:histidyl-tRNA synthetase